MVEAESSESQRHQGRTQSEREINIAPYTPSFHPINTQRNRPSHVAFGYPLSTSHRGITSHPGHIGVSEEASCCRVNQETMRERLDDGECHSHLLQPTLERVERVQGPKNSRPFFNRIRRRAKQECLSNRRKGWRMATTMVVGIGGGCWSRDGRSRGKVCKIKQDVCA